MMRQRQQDLEAENQECANRITLLQQEKLDLAADKEQAERLLRNDLEN